MSAPHQSMTEETPASAVVLAHVADPTLLLAYYCRLCRGVELVSPLLSVPTHRHGPGELVILQRLKVPFEVSQLTWGATIAVTALDSGKEGTGCKS